MRKYLLLIPLLLTPMLFLNSCTGIAEGVTPVKVDQKKYLGEWYEIARLDHSFERGLSEVTARYSTREDGGIKVLNKGLHAKRNKWTDVEGKAYFVKSDDLGHLKVSFFGPFYGSYVIFDLDQEDYQWAYITSYNKNYLWFISRTPTVSKERKQHFLEAAKNYGFKTDQLIFVEQKK